MFLIRLGCVIFQVSLRSSHHSPIIVTSTSQRVYDSKWKPHLPTPMHCKTPEYCWDSIITFGNCWYFNNGCYLSLYFPYTESAALHEFSLFDLWFEAMSGCDSTLVEESSLTNFHATKSWPTSISRSRLYYTAQVIGLTQVISLSMKLAPMIPRRIIRTYYRII